jgi:hypothetical protein
MVQFGQLKASNSIIFRCDLNETPAMVVEEGGFVQVLSVFF